MGENGRGDLLTLKMIVKDEAATIARTLRSVKPFVDRWIIADTGSTDATIEVVRRAMEDVPGELVTIPFTDFLCRDMDAGCAARHPRISRHAGGTAGEGPRACLDTGGCCGARLSGMSGHAGGVVDEAPGMLRPRRGPTGPAPCEKRSPAASSP
jgi:glycosyltransferase involved in cell wall biosynthesis